ncbi:uncharacterized protein PRCAT00003355001 [Priceomyces carsonii]|uniref:uncharacterized protein n=1 Tax=Priceomyces carsonii TaxID=28549 RepID=UPI002ED94F83|nr:unnamed protein product [Priceomyces carsonii]
MSAGEEDRTKKDSVGTPNVKRRKIESHTWLPPSVSSIADPLKFQSSTYLSDIPEAIISNPNEDIVLGVDEAGRGPVLGPMVYGIAYALEKYLNSLKREYGFADSKTLKEDKRLELFQIMLSKDDTLARNVGWATRTMTARDILSGMLQSTLGKGSYNLNDQAHDTTIQLIKDILNKGVRVTKLYVDTVGPPTSYQAKLKREFPGIEVTVAKKADSIYPIVSTASIVAKVTRDLNLGYFNVNLSTLVGANIGSGYPSDPNTSSWLNGNVDKVFGWNFGIIRFLWQTAKDSLQRNGAANVVYEEQCVKQESSYGNVSDFFNNSSSEQGEGRIDIRHYGSQDVVL